MTDLSTFVGHAWQWLLALVAAVAWLIRGEAKTNANSSEIQRLWKQREEDQRAHREARDTTNALLDEVRQDIKTLLARR